MKLFGSNLHQEKTWTDGTHRARSPGETVADYGRLMPHMGITRLANVTGLDNIGLPVYVAIRPNSRSLSTSQGKGLHLDAAKASALMEAVESWHGERVDRPLRFSSYLEMVDQVPVVDVRKLPRRRSSPLRLDVPLLWVEGWDLLADQATWVPYETVSTNFVLPAGAVSTFFMSTNGLASGNHLLEAISHAVCEIIERDSLTLWHLEDEETSKQRQVVPESVTDPSSRQVLEKIEDAGARIGIWDITSDSGIPAFAATLFEPAEKPNWRSMGMFSGYGCHTSPGIALLRALNESVQSRLTMISGSRDDLFPRDFVHCSNADDLRRMSEKVLNPPPARQFGARGSVATSSFEDDLALLLEALSGMGIENVVVVDLSREEVGIPVVKVVIPGLEGIILADNYSAGARARQAMSAGASQ